MYFIQLDFHPKHAELSLVWISGRVVAVLCSPSAASSHP